MLPSTGTMLTMSKLINSPSYIHKHRGSQQIFGGALSTKAIGNTIGRFVVDVHEYEHALFQQQSPAIHQHQSLQEVS